MVQPIAHKDDARVEVADFKVATYRSALFCRYFGGGNSPHLFGLENPGFLLYLLCGGFAELGILHRSPDIIQQE